MLNKIIDKVSKVGVSDSSKHVLYLFHLLDDHKLLSLLDLQLEFGLSSLSIIDSLNKFLSKRDFNSILPKISDSTASFKSLDSVRISLNVSCSSFVRILDSVLPLSLKSKFIDSVSSHSNVSKSIMMDDREVLTVPYAREQLEKLTVSLVYWKRRVLRADALYTSALENWSRTATGEELKNPYLSPSYKKDVTPLESRYLSFQEQCEDVEDNINRLREFLAKAAKDGTDVEPCLEFKV